MISSMPSPHTPPEIARWRQFRSPAILAVAWGLLMSINSGTPTASWLLRTSAVVFAAVLAYHGMARWPRALPGWFARWVYQLIGVVAAVPVGAFIAYCLTAEWPFWEQPVRVQGYAIVTFTGILFGPWIALTAMVRQRDESARMQALAFSLERSEYERNAVEARLKLLQAQVEPHFLFNTLANIRALVNIESSQASQVLDSLISYLRAATPRLHETATTIEQELQLTRAYLELMQLRMPDRLHYAFDLDPAAAHLRCLPMSILTLVENAVRHGIDPSEEGGRIDISIELQADICVIRVSDTGVGLGASNPGLGTGLTTLRERLSSAYGGLAQLRLSNPAGRGFCAELEFPMASPNRGSCSGKGG